MSVLAQDSNYMYMLVIFSTETDRDQENKTPAPKGISIEFGHSNFMIYL